MNRIKQIPKFASEAEEQKFWDSHELSDYFDIEHPVINPIFPNLKPSSHVISIRLPDSLIAALKSLANKRDVPYQSLTKILLAEKVKEETNSALMTLR